jgi:hypothetical protein
LKGKKQSSMQQKQAAHAVSLYHQFARLGLRVCRFMNRRKLRYIRRLKVFSKTGVCLQVLEVAKLKLVEITCFQTRKCADNACIVAYKPEIRVKREEPYAQATQISNDHRFSFRLRHPT